MTDPRKDQPVDMTRTLAGQYLYHAPRYGSTVAEVMFFVHGFSLLRESALRSTPIVKCYGKRVKKDGRPGMVDGECELFLYQVPSVDLRKLIDRERREVLNAVAQHAGRMDVLKTVLGGRNEGAYTEFVDDLLADALESSKGIRDAAD